VANGTDHGKRCMILFASRDILVPTKQQTPPGQEYLPLCFIMLIIVPLGTFTLCYPEVKMSENQLDPSYTLFSNESENERSVDAADDDDENPTTRPLNLAKSQEGILIVSPRKSIARAAKRVSRHPYAGQRQFVKSRRIKARSSDGEAESTQTMQSPNQESDTDTTLCTPSPPLLLSLPDDLRRREECISSTVTFTRSNFESGFWSFTSSLQWTMPDDTKAIGRALNMWQKRMLTARRMVQVGHAASGFELMNSCLDIAAELLKSNHPYGGMKIMTTVFERHQSLPALERALMRHLAQLTRVVLGAKHPLSVFLACACEMDKRQVIDLHWALRSIATSMYLAQGFLGDRTNLTFAVEDSSASTAPSEMMGGFLDESELETCENMLRQALQEDIEDPMKIRTRLAYTLVLQERLDEADEIYDEILTTLLRQDDDFMREDTNEILLDCHRGRLSVAISRGELENAIIAGFAMDNFCQAAFGLNSETRIDPLLNVQSLLKQLGREKEAKEIQRRWSRIWGKIQQKSLCWSDELNQRTCSTREGDY
jgi:hypothetical protein